MKNENSRQKWILIIVLLSYCVTAIDASIVVTALTLIQHDLNLNQVSLSWVQNSYLLAFGGMVLLGGKLGDIIGRKKTFISALLIFATGSLFAGISNGAVMMLAARFAQGIGAAMLAPTSLALLIDNFEGSKRVKAIAWYSSVSGIGTSIGMILGGTLASSLSWRYGFLINIPLAIFMIAVALKVLKTEHTHQEKFDYIGSLVSIIALFSIVYTINGATNIVFWVVISVLLLGSFLLIEKVQKNPMMPLSIFKDRDRTSAYITRALFVGSMMGYFIFISEFMQIELKFSPLMTGLGFVPLTVITFLAALFVPKAVEILGNGKVAKIGILLLVLGFILTVVMAPTFNYWLVVGFPMVFLGLGQGFAMSPLTNLGISNVIAKYSGIASGVVNAAHQVGGSIGISIMVSLTGTSSYSLSMFRKAMLIGLLLNIVALICISLMKPSKLKRIFNKN